MVWSAFRPTARGVLAKANVMRLPFWYIFLATLAAPAVAAGNDTFAPARLRLAPAPATLEHLSCGLDETQLALLEKLNRCDRDQLPRQQTIVLPERWDLRELDYSPLPHDADWARQLPTALIVHQPLQAFGAYVDGKLVYWGPVSSGSLENPTPKGLYFLNWRSKGRNSTVNPKWFLPWYFNFDNRSGRSFHQYQLPGEPASHGCVRLLERDARWLYDWGEEWALDERGWEITDYGTPVVIVGEFPHDETPPWREPSLLNEGFALARSGKWLHTAALKLLGNALPTLSGGQAPPDSAPLE